MGIDVYNGYNQSLVKVFSNKYNVLIESFTLDYPDGDGITEEQEIIGRIRTRTSGTKIPKIKGMYLTWEISWKEFTLKANYAKIKKILNYILNDNKKIVLYPHANGRRNYEVGLHPDSYTMAERIVYDRVSPIGYEGLGLKFITLELQNQHELYDPDLTDKFTIGYPNGISINTAT